MPFSILDDTNSPNFNVANWGDSRRALVRNNERKGNGAPRAAFAIRKLREIRFDNKIEAAKVVNVETPIVAATPTVSAVSVGMTVAALRKVAKARGLKGYSKLRKADLLAALA